MKRNEVSLALICFVGDRAIELFVALCRLKRVVFFLLFFFKALSLEDFDLFIDIAIEYWL